jgi:hypothetical protein
MPLAALKLGPDFTKGMVLGKLRRLALAEARAVLDQIVSRLDGSLSAQERVGSLARGVPML